jgi:hypothetical protein
VFLTCSVLPDKLTPGVSEQDQIHRCSDTPQPDGKTVVVYDTASNTVIGSFVTDQNAGASPRSIAVAADGTLYITDMDDNKGVCGHGRQCTLGAVAAADAV